MCENKYRLIAYFLVSICAKNYQSRFVFVRVIARQSSDIFGHSVHLFCCIAFVLYFVVSSFICFTNPSYLRLSSSLETSFID